VGTEVRAVIGKPELDCLSDNFGYIPAGSFGDGFQHLSLLIAYPHRHDVLARGFVSSSNSFLVDLSLCLFFLLHLVLLQKSGLRVTPILGTVAIA
jgi:hypothetical protein